MQPRQVRKHSPAQTSFRRFAVIAQCHDVQRLPGDTDGFSVQGELLDAVQLP